MKSFKVITLSLVLACGIAFLGTKETPDDVDAFNVSNNVSDAEAYIEAYQTTNCSEIEAYVTDVHYVDER